MAFVSSQNTGVGKSKHEAFHSIYSLTL